LWSSRPSLTRADLGSYDLSKTVQAQVDSTVDWYKENVEYVRKVLDNNEENFERQKVKFDEQEREFDEQNNKLYKLLMESSKINESVKKSVDDYKDTVEQRQEELYRILNQYRELLEDVDKKQEEFIKTIETYKDLIIKVDKLQKDNS